MSNSEENPLTAAEMAAYNWVYSTVSCGGVEFATFVLVDHVIKSPLKDAASMDERRIIWLVESCVLSFICFVVYVFHHIPYLLILLTCITFMYTQIIKRISVTNFLTEIKAHWDNHIQHEESMKQIERQKQQQLQQQQSVPNFTQGMAGDFNNLAGQNVEPGYGMGFSFLTKNIPIHYPPNATVIPGQDTPAYSLNPSTGSYRDAVRQTRDIFSTVGRNWNKAATNYSASNTQNALSLPSSGLYDNKATSLHNVNSYDCPIIWSNQQLPRRSLHPDVGEKVGRLTFPNILKSTVMNYIGLGPSSEGPTGLVNYGQNICFINSVVQCLARSPFLVKNLTALAGKELECSAEEQDFLTSLAELLDILIDPSQARVLSASEFCTSCARLNTQYDKPDGRPMRQQDAAEFLMWLLETLHNIINRNRHALDSDRSWQVSKYKFTNSRLAYLKRIYGDLSPSRIFELKEQCRKDIDIANGLDKDSYGEAIQRLSDLEWLTFMEENDSIVNNLFTGQLVEVHSSVNHGSISVHLQTFNVLPVPIGAPTNFSGLVMLGDCFTNFCNIENVTEGTDWSRVNSRNEQEAAVRMPSAHRYTQVVVSSGHTPVNRQHFRLNQGYDAACLPSPIHPSVPQMLPGSSLTPGLVSSPSQQSFMKDKDSGGFNNTFSTSTPVSRDGYALRQQNMVLRRCLLRQLPECLIIHLMRFRFDPHVGVPVKVRTSVDIHLRKLNLQDVMYDKVVQCSDMTAPNTGYVYELYGMCLHLGAESTSCGHYICYCLDRGKWYRMDDDRVDEVNIDFQLTTEEIRQNAYILFYRRITPVTG